MMRGPVAGIADNAVTAEEIAMKATITTIVAKIVIEVKESVHTEDEIVHELNEINGGEEQIEEMNEKGNGEVSGVRWSWGTINRGQDVIDRDAIQPGTRQREEMCAVEATPAEGGREETTPELNVFAMRRCRARGRS